MTSDAAPARPRFLLSAYAASPAHGRWDPDLEGELLPALVALPDVVGLEVPWMGSLHPHDPDWFLRHIPAGTRLAVTPLPFIMGRCAADPTYGIASPAAAGREAAIADLRRLAADVRTLREASDADVAVVALHTAPRGGADAIALAASLTEIAGMDWDGAELVIEHCDALVPGQPFEKGFLPVGEELAVIAATDVPIGLWLNWGRSAVELRDADAVTAQIAEVAASGRLRGLVFSGTAGTDGPYGAAWSDAHLPLLAAEPDSGSLLDDAHVRAALAAAGDVPWLGLKVSRRAHDTTAADVVGTISRNLDLVRATWDAGDRA